MKWGNCWTYAIKRWIEEGPASSYIIMRFSKRAPHVLHAFFTKSIENTEVEEYYAKEPKQGWRAWLHAPWFKGKIRKGIGEE